MLDNTGLGIALTECYCDRQPELLYHLYEELGEDKPAALTDLFSPAKSSQPPSVTSALGSTNGEALHRLGVTQDCPTGTAWSHVR